jgi:PAS domain S-box-containing protein
MTSLPMPACLDTGAAALPPGLADFTKEQSEQFLLRAFRSFAEAADSLERSYSMLRAEVARLRSELEQSNAGLNRSLAENRQMRLHLNRILEGLPCGVLVAKAGGEITLVNPEARRLLDAAAGATSDRNSNHVFQMLAELPTELRDLLEQARTAAGDQELCLAEHSGGGRWLSARHATVGDGAGAESVSIFILRDISEAKRLVRERDKLRREQALAEMSAILAHEIRNPLGSLELFAGLLAGAGLSPECREWVEHVQAGLRTLAATVNNVLHFHSLPEPSRTPTVLGELLDWAAGFFLPMARQARVELCVRNRLQGVSIAADRHRLEQVLLNLVLNALTAMPGGGRVEICGHATEDERNPAAVIVVNDSGPGVPAAHGEEIFVPGFSTRPGGPGLGLAVCRKIVEQHGGSLVSTRRAGVGASFTISFPLPPEDARERATERERAGERWAQRTREVA